MALRGHVVRAARLALAAPLVAAGACGKTAAPGRDTTPAAVAASAGGAAARPACPKTGHWSACQVKTRLDAAGVAPQPDSGKVELPALGATPTVYLVGKSPLAVYLYPDAAARERAARSLDSTKFIAPAAALSMRGEATAIQNDNLLALLFSRNDQQRERVSDALMAGAPQP
jgi:hypothetical protein